MRTDYTKNNRQGKSKNSTRNTAPVSDVLLNANLTDQGNAECLRALYGDKLRYCAERGCWMLWNGVVWQPNADHEVRQMIVETARRRRKTAAELDTENNEARIKRLINWSLTSEHQYTLKCTLAAASDLPDFYTTIDQYDADINLLGVKNGVINLTTGEFMEPDPGDYLTMQSGVEFD